MKAHQSTVGKNDEWLTPPAIIEQLGPFDLDPCAPVVRAWPTANMHYTIEDDGLSHEWDGRVWCNPPFNRFERPEWMKRVAEHGNAMMLIPAACETEAFFAHVWGKADAVLFLKGRPHFHYVDGERAKMNCGTAICIVAYGRQNAEILSRSGLGHFVAIHNAELGRTDEGGSAQ